MGDVERRPGWVREKEEYNGVREKGRNRDRQKGKQENEIT